MFLRKLNFSQSDNPAKYFLFENTEHQTQKHFK